MAKLASAAIIRIDVGPARQQVRRLLSATRETGQQLARLDEQLAEIEKLGDIPEGLPIQLEVQR